MQELEQTKTEILDKLIKLCAHCEGGVEHVCSVQNISLQIKNFRGIPLIVNNEFRGLIYSQYITK